jgi:excisionase family DNA binding protein
MRNRDDRTTGATEGAEGRRKAPASEARPPGRAAAARDPRAPTRSLRCARCQDLHDPRTLIAMTDVALRLGTSVRHVRRLVAERRIPIVKVGRFVRFDAHEIEHWIDDHRVAPARSAFPRRRGN